MSELDFSQLSEVELRDKLKAVGVAVGPITSTTRRLFENKLRRKLNPENEESGASSTGEEAPAAPVETLVPEATGPKTYFGVALPPEKCDPQKAEECVFEDRKEALKFAKSATGARFKEFQNRECAVSFASTPAVQQPNYMPPVTTPVSEASLFKGPKVPELSKFRLMIEKGQLTEMYETMWGNPRFLISSGDSPVILQVGCRYNALHVCALKNKPEAAQLILDTLEDTAFMARLYPDDSDEARENRIKHLVDLYLNMPDKGNCEGPLHFACKFGNLEMVRFLVQCPHINLQQCNSYGEIPRQVVCSRAPSKGNKVEILGALEATYYIPLMRPADKSSIAKVGTPWSPAKGQELDLKQERVRKNNNTGDPTLSPLVVHAYAGPMSPSQAQTFRRKWMQHTSQKDRLNFLSICCKDDEKGLERIGRLLAKDEGVRWSEYWEFLEEYIDLSTPEGLRLLDEYLEQINLDVSICIPNLNDSPLVQNDKPTAKTDQSNHNDKEDSFMALLGNEFAKLKIYSPSPEKCQVENIGSMAPEMQGIEQGMEGIQMEAKKLDFDEVPTFCDTTSDGQGKFKANIVENVGVHNKHALPVCDNADLRFSMMRAREERVSGETEFESCDSASDKSVDTYYTAFGDVALSPPYSSPFPHKEQPVFLLGLEPSKVDTDVLYALGDHPITPEYPNVMKWRKYVTAFNEETRNSWTSPRRDHRLNLSLGSPHSRDRSFNSTPMCTSRIHSFVTPQRLTPRLSIRHTPTLMNRETVRTNLSSMLDV